MTNSTPSKLAYIAPQLREIAPYVQSLKGSLAVVLIPGELSCHDSYQSVISDLILLHSLGVKLAVVFGSRPQINQAIGKPAKYHNNIRVTSKTDMQRIVELSASERLRHQRAFRTHSSSGSDNLSAVWSSWISARPLGVVDGIDMQQAGFVRRINTKAALNLLENDHILLFDVIALSPTGDIYNLVAEELAVELAIQLHAQKLLIYCDLSDDKLELPIRLTMNKAEQLVGTASDKLTQPLSSAINARNGLVARVYLLDMHLPDAILHELLTINGASIMLSDDDYESIDAAHEQDIGAILALIEPMIAKGLMLPRDHRQLETSLHIFRVMRRDKVVIGCYSLEHLCNEVVEFGCFAVLRKYQRTNLGRDLLNDAISYTQDKSLVTFTTSARDWFIENGFVQLQKPVTQLPDGLQQRIKENVANDRNAQCLALADSPIMLTI